MSAAAIVNRGADLTLVKHDEALQTEIVTVTPDLAGDWLARAHKNRRLSNITVERYAEQMLEGKWRLNGEALIFDSHHRLLDGQHRLSAVVMAGVAVPMLVVTGVDPSTFTTMDAGRSRKVTDFVHVEGYAYSTQLPTVANAIYYYDLQHHVPHFSGGSKLGRTVRRLTADELLPYLAEHGETFEKAMTVAVSVHISRISRGILAACYIIFERIDEEQAQEFFDLLRTGANLDEDSPILKVRNRFLTMGQQRGSLRQNEQAALLIKAWNFWRQGRTVKQLTWKPGQEAFPIAE